MGVSFGTLEVEPLSFGSTDLSSIHLGDTLIWEKSTDPYPPGTVLVNSAGPQTFTTELEPGVYYIDVTGGGGGSYNLQFKAGDMASRWVGSGAGSCYGEFYLNTRSTITLIAGEKAVVTNDPYISPEATDGICTINNSTFLLAGHGTSNAASTNDPQPGGNCTINNLQEITNISIIGATGNSGYVYRNSTAAIIVESVSPHGWGGVTSVYSGVGSKGQNGDPGGIYLEYLRRNP